MFYRYYSIKCQSQYQIFLKVKKKKRVKKIRKSGIKNALIKLLCEVFESTDEVYTANIPYLKYDLKSWYEKHYE